MNIAKALKERRLALNISQDKLAAHCGFAHRANISRLETGKLEWKWRDVMKACVLLSLKIEIQEVKERTNKMPFTVNGVSLTDYAKQIEAEYHSMAAANGEWGKSLGEFAREHLDDEDLWTVFPDEARQLGLDEPEWL